MDRLKPVPTLGAPTCYTSHIPDMPLQELLGILIVIAVIWIVLKMMKVAIRLILFVIGLVLVAGAIYYLFMR